MLAKYYKPPHAAQAQAQGQAPAAPAGGQQGLTTLKEQRAFEKSVFEKTKRGGGESGFRGV